METEGSLPHSQQPATCHYTEPYHSSSSPLPTSWSAILILSSYLCLSLSSGLFPSGFLTKTLHVPLLSRTCYVPHPSHSSWHGWNMYIHVLNVWPNFKSGKLHWVNTCTRYCLYILNTAAFFKLTPISVFTHPFTWWHTRQWSLLFKFPMGGGQYTLV
jgi:hypothetical protein